MILDKYGRKGKTLRWVDLFADLESQVTGLARAERDGEIAERTRIDFGRLTLAARLRGTLGHPVELHCRGADACRGRLDRIGPDWVLVADAGTEWLAPTAALTVVTGLGRHSEVTPGGPTELSLRSVLRRIAQDRSPVRVALVDSTVRAGTIDRVGVDFFELAEHPVDEPRRAGAVIAVRTIPTYALSVLSRR